ncbi:energy transducer TonB [Halomonas sp. 328]|uniref:energy transducer TonB n=1 Tax=Halomonas sp. 328 TaxID=2776704 RepID=UPI0018A7B60E|nr:energy transducer TonB [Halomonas sp. 328]MBF8223014.1 TonB family protein [Halomonas sp. 328]
MTRVPVSALGGAALALLLFWLLALLVAPPEAEIDVLDAPLSMNLVEAPEAVPEEVAAEAPPPAEVAPPPPLPEPAPPQASPVSLPEPELPPQEVEPVEFDEPLPELVEARPDPVPEPSPEPTPEPSPAPAPNPAPSPSEAPAEPAGAPAQGQPSAAPVEVGALAPTSRVPPDYPSRAQRRGIEGHVELRFLIRADGSVDADSIQVISAQPRNVFDRAARQAVARWRFEPAQGLRRAQQRLEFQLR